MSRKFHSFFLHFRICAKVTSDFDVLGLLSAYCTKVVQSIRPPGSLRNGGVKALNGG